MFLYLLLIIVIIKNFPFIIALINISITSKLTIYTIIIPTRVILIYRKLEIELVIFTSRVS